MKEFLKRYAYEQKQRSLTQLLVQQEFVAKWDGKLPVYDDSTLEKVTIHDNERE